LVIFQSSGPGFETVTMPIIIHAMRNQAIDRSIYLIRMMVPH
jgi:tyrosine-protein phosphatase YwqE